MKTSRIRQVVSIVRFIPIICFSQPAVGQSTADPVTDLAEVAQMLAKEMAFNVKAEDGCMKVSWTVPGEGGIAYYEIYRSAADQSLNRVCTFRSVGSTDEASYSFNDRSVQSTGNEYRLLLVDAQGQRVMLDITPTFASR